MSLQEKLVAVISPWEKLTEAVKNGLRVQSLPREKKVRPLAILPPNLGKRHSLGVVMQSASFPATRVAL